MNAPFNPIKAVTTVSTKGQIVLPRATRDRLGWKAGDTLVVEDTPEGVLLRRRPSRAPSRLEDVRGILKWTGAALSPEAVRSGAMKAVEDKWRRIEETGSAYEEDDLP